MNEALTVRRAFCEVVLGVQDYPLPVLGLAEYALHNEGRTQADARERLSAQPPRDELSGPIAQGCFDRAASLPWIDPDALNDAGDLDPLAGEGVGQGYHGGHG